MARGTMRTSGADRPRGGGRAVGRPPGRSTRVICLGDVTMGRPTDGLIDRLADRPRGGGRAVGRPPGRSTRVICLGDVTMGRPTDGLIDRLRRRSSRKILVARNHDNARVRRLPAGVRRAEVPLPCRIVDTPGAGWVVALPQRLALRSSLQAASAGQSPSPRRPPRPPGEAPTGSASRSTRRRSVRLREPERSRGVGTGPGSATTARLQPTRASWCAVVRPGTTSPRTRCFASCRSAVSDLGR